MEKPLDEGVGDTFGLVRREWPDFGRSSMWPDTEGTQVTPFRG